MHFSEQNPNASDSRVGAVMAPAGAPVHDIEVTPAMIEAGKNVLVYDYEPQFQKPEDVATRVYLAMLGAKDR